MFGSILHANMSIYPVTLYWCLLKGGDSYERPEAGYAAGAVHCLYPDPLARLRYVLEVVVVGVQDGGGRGENRSCTRLHEHVGSREHGECESITSVGVNCEFQKRIEGQVFILAPFKRGGRRPVSCVSRLN